MTADKTNRPIIQQYLSLAKPGVLLGNVITGAAGFGLASSTWRYFDPILFVATIAGMTLVIAAACALNNALDADIDSIMERTKTRAVASGAVPKVRAIIFAAVRFLIGEAILAVWVDWLVFWIGLAGFITYVGLYGALAKRHSFHGTLVGSISGAAPILAGYCAVTGFIDVGAVLVFSALVLWPLPGFYSIST